MLFPLSRSGSGRQRPRQSLCLVAWSLQTLRSLLIPYAHPASFFPLPMGDRGQGKEMSFFQKTIERQTEQSKVASFERKHTRTIRKGCYDETHGIIQR
jgi:hypothetical protein